MKKTADPQQNVSEQLSQVEQTAGGVEGVKKKYEVALKKGGPVFDPEGSGYDYETAKKYGIKPDKTGHMPSRAPSGQILKGRKHKTYEKTLKGEKEAGYVIEKGKDKKYYSKPLSDYMGSFKKGGMVCRGQGAARKKKFKVY